MSEESKYLKSKYWWFDNMILGIKRL